MIVIDNADLVLEQLEQMGWHVRMQWSSRQYQVQVMREVGVYVDGADVEGRIELESNWQPSLDSALTDIFNTLSALEKISKETTKQIGKKK